MQLLSRLFPSKNARELKRMGKIVAQINALEPKMSALSDEQIRSAKDEFKQRLAAGETLDALLPEAFALTREAAKRAIGLRHFDVQLIGAITLHEGRIAEMRTGEGKTLVATLALYLNALEGEGVHLVTVNDYLARRDAHWMGPVYQALGMTVGVIHSGQSNADKKLAYGCDITYGTNNEFGFDYLRNNMAFSLNDRVQRKLHYAIVDEVDSILIDEARTPLIISGGIEDNSQLYRVINELVPSLEPQEKTAEDIANGIEPPGHYHVDEKQRDVELTEAGHQLVEDLLIKRGLLGERGSLYGTANLNLLHHVQVALKAHLLFKRDVDYVVQNNEVVIVDEHTGRTMAGRRWSGGIHQAIEAKENLPISQESQTLASTTFQNYFRLYHKLSGMTGTADTEAFEFRQIYGLDVVVIPTNLPMIRKDFEDVIYLTEAEKFDAIVKEIGEATAKGMPVLVGTASIESSERLSELLKRMKVKHSVLNAKLHEREAEIVAQAGRPGTVTIATNMAGRGTDIVLGGNWQVEISKLENPSEEQVRQIREEWAQRHAAVLAAGGLYIIGSERHESRRIDNQLRGRSGRQGDPGQSRFFLSLEDNLMRIFASDRVKNMMRTLGMEKGEAIEHRMVSNAIEKAQRKVEGRNFDIRKQLLEYDDVANDQRQMIYRQRDELMESDDVSATIDVLWSDVVNQIIDGYMPPQSLEEQWQIAELEQALHNEFNVSLPIRQWLDEEQDLEEAGVRSRIVEQVKEQYRRKCALVGPQIRLFEKQIMLQIVDNLWKEHLAAMDYLRQGIHLRAYAQKQPKQEYKREAFQLFEELLNNIKLEVIRFLARVQFRTEETAEQLEEQRRQAEAAKAKLQREISAANPEGAPNQAETEPFVRKDRKVGRNEPCPCGSGKKYKACHGRL